MFPSNIELTLVILVVFITACYTNNESKPFRINKLNIIWKKVQNKMAPQKLENLKSALRRQDTKEQKWKDIKLHGGDASGEIEAELRRALFRTLDQYGFGEYVGHVSPGKVLEPGVKDNTLRSDEDATDKRLAQLWQIAENEGKFNKEEMEDLQTEFKHHRQKIDEYKLLMNTLKQQHSISENSIENHDQMNDNQMDKLKDELKEKYNEMNYHYDQLKERVTGEENKQPFKDHRVVELWERALEQKFSEEELQSMKEELKHFDHKISKHEHFKKQAQKTEQKIRAGEKIDQASHQETIKRAKQHGKYVKKLHHTLLDKVSQRNEL